MYRRKLYFSYPSKTLGFERWTRKNWRKYVSIRLGEPSILIFDGSTHWTFLCLHYNDVIMSAMASQITSGSIVYLTGCSGTDQRKHQSSAPLAFVRGIHRWPVNSPHKGPETRKMFPFDDVIMWPSRGAKLWSSLHQMGASAFWFRGMAVGSRGMSRSIKPC